MSLVIPNDILQATKMTEDELKPNLAAIGQLYLLRQLYKTIIIPQAVYSNPISGQRTKLTSAI